MWSLGYEINWYFPEQIQDFECCVGREEELELLRQDFMSNRNPDELAVQVNAQHCISTMYIVAMYEDISLLPFQVVTGCGGMGKTELIFEYARRHRRDYKHGVYYFFLQSLSTFYDSVRCNVCHLLSTIDIMYSIWYDTSLLSR